MERRDPSQGASVPAVLFLLVFGLYLFSAYPAIAPRDNADMASAAITLGLAHPPGYPFYAALGRAWMELLVLGNPAYRLNVLSAAAGAGAVLLVFLTLRRLGGTLAALGGALALALNLSLWKFSLLEEKYSIHALITAALFFLAVPPAVKVPPETAGDARPPASTAPRSGSRRRALLSALLFGLGLANHQSMILMMPAMLLMWRREIAAGAAPGMALMTALGLAPYLAVWTRLGDIGAAWAVVTRAQYGTFELFRGLSAGSSLGASAALLSHLFKGLVSSLGPAAALLGAAGLAAGLWPGKKGGEDFRELAWGLGLALIAFGPVYFLMTRFDVSGWVGRSVLESSFIVPGLCLSLSAGMGIAVLGRAFPPAGRLPFECAAAALIALTGVFHWERASHRDDFSAYDYARDLRRSIAPGGAALVAGDTAIFSLEYLGLVLGSGDRALRRAVGEGAAEWLRSRASAGPVYTVGLGEIELKGLGLWESPPRLEPLALVQRLSGDNRRAAAELERMEEDAWSRSILRTPRAALLGESYARDVVYSYAYARFLSGRIFESLGRRQTAWRSYAHAMARAPEDFTLERIPGD